MDTTFLFNFKEELGLNIFPFQYKVDSEILKKDIEVVIQASKISQPIIGDKIFGEVFGIFDSELLIFNIDKVRVFPSSYGYPTQHVYLILLDEYKFKLDFDKARDYILEKANENKTEIEKKKRHEKEKRGKPSLLKRLFWGSSKENSQEI